MLKDLCLVYKIKKEIITLDHTEVEKRKFHYSKYPINISNADVGKTIISDKAFVGEKGFKYFTGYRDDKRLCILPPKMS